MWNYDLNKNISFFRSLRVFHCMGKVELPNSGHSLALSSLALTVSCDDSHKLQFLTLLQRFAGRLSEENRQGIPCGFVSTLHITTSGLSPALWFIQCTCTLQNHKVHPVCLIYLQSAVCILYCSEKFKVTRSLIIGLNN